MTSVRPSLHPLVQPNRPAAADAARLAAQRAFFDIAAGKAASAAAPVRATTQTTQTAPAGPAPTVRRTPDVAPGEAPTRPLRPGSLLDIRV